MSKTIFQLIADVVAGTENKVAFDIQGRTDGTIKVVITPKLGAVAANASKEAKQLHAAMHAPLVVVGTASDVESALLERIDTFTATINTGMSALDEVRSLAASAVAAAKSTTAKAVTTPTAPEGGDDEGEGLDGNHESEGGDPLSDALPGADVKPASIHNF